MIIDTLPFSNHVIIKHLHTNMLHNMVVTWASRPVSTWRKAMAKYKKALGHQDVTTKSSLLDDFDSFLIISGSIEQQTLTSNKSQ